MASKKIRGITVEIGGDVSGLNKALESTNKQVKSTQTQLKDVQRLLKLDPSNTELLRQKQQLLGQAVAETGQKLDQLKKLEQQLKDSGVEENSAQFMAVRREIISTTAEMESLEDAAKRFASVKFQQLSQSLGNISEKAEAAGRVTTQNVTKPIVEGFTSAVKITANFDKSMSQVAAISGVAGDELETLRNKAREMGAATKFSAADAADAMNYMAMAGWKANDMLSGIEGIMALAAASGEDLATTSDIVTDALTAFGYSAADAGHFADVLAAASSNANTNVSMMGESFKYVAPVAGSLGYSAEDVATALGLMANSGIKASQAGTSLRNILTRMAKPTKESGTAMAVLGLSLDDGAGNMKSFMEVMQDFRKGFGQIQIPVDEFEASLTQLDEAFDNGEMSEKDYEAAMNELIQRAYGAEGANKAMYASMLAGQRGMSALLAIVNASDEDFEKLTESIYNCDGAAENMAAIMQDNLSGQMEILMSQLQELAISVGDILMPVIRTVVDWLQRVMDWLNSLEEDTKNTIVTIAAIVAAIGPLLIVIGNVAGGVKKIIDLWPMLKGLAAGIKAFAAANPIVLIIAAIVALVALIATKGDEIQAILQKVDDFLQNIFATDFTKIFGPVLGEALNMFFANVKNVWDSIKQIFDGIIDFVRGVFSGDWSRAWNGIKEIFSGVFSGLTAIAKAPLNAIIGLINGLISGVNWLIRKLNGIRITPPKWVTTLTGIGSFGFNLSELSKIPYLANGGILSRGSAVVGEAGPELLTMAGGSAVVQPLTSNTTHNRSTYLGGMTVNVYAAPGQDVEEIADAVLERAQQKYDQEVIALA